MDEFSYPSNSNKSKEEALAKPEKRVEKAVTGSVKIKKKSEIKKLTDVFISEDISNVKQYVVMDVLIPAIKKAISDIITNGVDMILYGESGRSKKNRPSSKISYRDYYERDRDRRDYDGSRARSGYEFDDVIIETRAEAEDVLSRMDDLVSSYGVVSVADYYDLVGVRCEYTANNYGWTNIRNADVVRHRDGGFVIKLPRAMPIK